jgi:hypothetical protein
MKVYVAVCWRSQVVVNVGVFTNKQSANAFGERYDDWEVYEREVDEQ